MASRLRRTWRRGSRHPAGLWARVLLSLLSRTGHPSQRSAERGEAGCTHGHLQDMRSSQPLVDYSPARDWKTLGWGGVVTEQGLGFGAECLLSTAVTRPCRRPVTERGIPEHLGAPEPRDWVGPFQLWELPGVRAAAQSAV